MMWRLPSFQRYFSDHGGALKSMDIGPDGCNSLLIQFFNWNSPSGGTFYRDFAKEIPYLSRLGITCVWLPPPNKAMQPDGHGYDAYDLWDLGEFERNGMIRTRWGTKEELIQAVAVAKSASMRILVDAVLNHKMGADRTETFVAVECDPKDRRREVGKPRTIEGWTAFDFPGRNDKHSTLKWTSAHFSGLDYDVRSGRTAVFRICGDGHKGWSKHVDHENGNYDYLIGADIDHSNAEARQDLLCWGDWVLQETGATGFRLDACKHIDRVFLRDFLRHVRVATGRSSLPSIGELWVDNSQVIDRYIRFFDDTLACFDVPLHYNFHRASKDSDFDLRDLMTGSLLSKRPGDAVTFVDNHDTQPGGSLESWVTQDFKLLAYALILLWPLGLPCLFHGDLYGIKGRESCPALPGLDKLALARRYLAFGSLKAYFDHRGTVGFVRQGKPGHGACAVVLRWSTGPSTKQMDVGTNNANSTWIEIFGHDDPVKINERGIGRFAGPVRGIGVWMRTDAQCRSVFR